MSDPIWPVSVEKIDEVIFTWQNPETVDGVAEDATDAEALVQALAHHGLQILPIAADDTPHVVEIDGRPVSWLNLPAPHLPNDAVGVWFATRAEVADQVPLPAVVLRPATPEEIAEDHALDRESVKPWLSSSS